MLCPGFADGPHHYVLIKKVTSLSAKQDFISMESIASGGVWGRLWASIDSVQHCHEGDLSTAQLQ